MKPIIIGHRGASGHAPENTLKAFAKAIELGAQMIEFDVHVCRSGHVVIIHDDTVDRTTNGTGKVKDFTLAELKQLDAGEGEQIPTLQELLDYINRRIKIDIELKGADTAIPVLTIIEHYVQHKGWEYDDFLITSYDHYQLQIIKEKVPSINIAPITYSMLIDYVPYLHSLKAEGVVVSIDSLRDPFAELLLQSSIPIYVFTVNDPDEMNELIHKNIAGIITDYPDRFNIFYNKNEL